MKLSHLAVLPIGTLLLASMLSGCSPSAGSDTSEVMRNSETVSGLIYRATGSVGDGPDDAIINIATTTSDTEGAKDVNTILPWTRTTSGADGLKVKMTVESLSSDGEVQCQIFYQDIIIIHKASGDHAVATCEGTLDSYDELTSK